MNAAPKGLRAKALRIRRLMRKEIRQLFRDPRTKRIIFASPIVQLILFGYAVNTDVRNVPVFVQDYDRTAESRGLVQSMTAGYEFRLAGMSDRAADLTRALDRGEATVGLVIPAGFQDDLAAGRTADVQVIVDGTNSNTGVVAQGYATRAIQAYGLRRAAERRGAAPDPPVQLDARAWFNPGLVSRVYNVPAVVGMIVMIMSMLLTALSVVRERELGTLDQLLVSPLSPGELMLGKTIPVAGIAMVQLALVTAVALLWFRIPFRGSFLLLLFAAMLFILAGLAVGLLISTVSRTQQEAFLGLFLTLFPVVILSGFLYPVETMPPFFERLSLLNPLHHFLVIARSVFLKGSGLDVLWPQVGALGGMAVVGLWAAARRFRGAVG